MKSAIHAFVFQRGGHMVTVAGGQLVNDDDPVLDSHGDFFEDVPEPAYVLPKSNPELLPESEPEPEPEGDPVDERRFAVATDEPEPDAGEDETDVDGGEEPEEQPEPAATDPEPARKTASRKAKATQEG